MLKWIIRSRLAAFETKYSYDMSYARDMLAADLRAFFAFARVTPMSNYRRGVTKDAYWAAKLVGTVSEDCGPCTQLMVSLGLHDGADPKQLAAVLAGRDADLTADTKLAVEFARASLARSSEADELRDAVVAKWGPRGLVSIAFAITAARIFPTLKYALGHGRACQRVVVAGEPIVVAHATSFDRSISSEQQV